MAEQTYQRVCRVIGQLAGLEPDSIGPGQSLGYEQRPNMYASTETRPLELDSLDRVDLAMKLEEEFSIQIRDDEVDNPAIDHVGGLVAFVQGKLDVKTAAENLADVLMPALMIEHPLEALIDTAKVASLIIGSSGEGAGGVFGIDLAASAEDYAAHCLEHGIASHTATTGVLELTEDMRLTNSGVLDIDAKVKTGLGELGPIRLDPSRQTPWQRARDVLNAAGLNAHELLVPEWEWYAMRQRLVDGVVEWLDFDYRAGEPA